MMLNGTNITIPMGNMTANMTIPPNCSNSSFVLETNTSAIYGEYLVDNRDFALYIFLNDSNGMSSCYNSCAVNWPPVLLNDCNGTAWVNFEGDIMPNLIGATLRTDDTAQLMYNNQPLYYFIGDKMAGDATGEGQENFFLLNFTGFAIMANATNSTPPVVNLTTVNTTVS